MKFKTLFVLFNIVIFVSFAFLFFLPLPVLGWEYAWTFWAQNWLLALAFAAVLGGLDAYFLVNWKLFRLLEREDWAGLFALLDAELARRGVLGAQKTKIFLNACLITQNPSRIHALRETYLVKKARCLPQVALSLGLPLILEGKSEAIEAFFVPYLNDRRTGADGSWIRWAVAFGRLLRQDTEGARPLLEGGIQKTKEPVLALLSLYLLDNLRHQDAALATSVDQQRAALHARFTPKEWSNAIDALKERVVLVVFMEKLIQEARQWLAAPGGKA